MRKSYLIISIAALLFTACSTDISDGLQQKKTVPLTITAVKGTGATRSTFVSDDDDNVTATWSITDKLIVVFNGVLTELPLASGEGTTTATFSGELEYNATKPVADEQLTLYVKNPNIDINVEDGSYTYKEGRLTSQPGTLAGAAALNVYTTTTSFGDGTISGVTFVPTCSLMKFEVTVPGIVSANTTATLTYSYVEDEEEKSISATFTAVATPETNDIWFCLPPGSHTSNTLTLSAGSVEITNNIVDESAEMIFAAATSYSNAQEFEAASYYNQIALGDLVYNDGTYSTDLDLRGGTRTPVAIVVYVGNDEYTEPGTVIAKGTVNQRTVGGHALCMSLKKIATNYAFGNSTIQTTSIGRVTNETLAGITASGKISGYKITTSHIARCLEKDQWEYTSSWFAYNYTLLQAPYNSTGWFLPSAAQMYKTGCFLLDRTYFNIGGSYTSVSDVFTKLTSKLTKAGTGNYDTFSGSVWTCTEDAQGSAFAFETSSSWGVMMGTMSKTIKCYNRPFFAL